MSRSRQYADHAARQRAYRARKRHAADASNVTPGSSGVFLAVADAGGLPLPDGVVDLIVTSPPYGLGKEYGTADDPASWPARMHGWLAEMYRVTREPGRLALNVPFDTTKGGWRPTYLEAGQAAIAAGWTYRSTIVWHEGNARRTVARGSNGPNSPHAFTRSEAIVWFSKGRWDLGRAGPACDLTHDEWLTWTDGDWCFRGETRPWEKHPAAFPEELPRRLIKLLSFPGAVVLDPFCGSGTTVVVARRLGRVAIGCDVNPAFLASTRRRLGGDPR